MSCRKIISQVFVRSILCRGDPKVRFKVARYSVNMNIGRRVVGLKLNVWVEVVLSFPVCIYLTPLCVAPCQATDKRLSMRHTSRSKG